MIPRPPSRRRPLRRLLFGMAVLAYLLAGVMAVLAWWVRAEQPQEVVGGLMASIVFFTGVGLVLHVLANASLPDLRVKR